MNYIDKEFLRNKLDTVELDSVRLPQRLDSILERGKGIDPVKDTGEAGMQKIGDLEDAPQYAPFIRDYWELDGEIEERLEEYIEDLDQPGLEGAKKATEAIEAQREKEGSSFSIVVGFHPDERDDYNLHQVGGPQGDKNLVELPDWMLDDDWFSDVENGYVARVVDDHTVYARHIRENVQDDRPSGIDEAQFWQAYNETIDSYLD